MNKRHIYNILNIVTVILTVTMFFSCSDNFNQIQKMGVSENEPIGVAENINLKHTDSGRLTANLLSAKMLDYSNRDFPFNEFTGGITLYVFDEENKKSTIVSDYAIIYNNTDLIDLQGNVVITTHDGNVLKTEQLYYDQNREWLFSNHLVEIISSDGSSMKGNIFDSDAKFTNVEVLEANGNVLFNE
ncbi:LPS export ABC transporter periplasmic protein LptC [Flavivirga rizhaonensis]|uniref:LPS export ABC transporter periplasmic protein LptC n=1 Tax=Flavivirga rizhaonensis TaxID=2559571 RepID=A0A4S1E047_9FLAO|nr:LPS export ABC transporter periplasmic protein LptC [Flavivirga rizhaonensis]TGV03268.1 LPS export ABC transporter periplasmic protein LptC [Flavivirga rizhaonensis]